MKKIYMTPCVEIAEVANEVTILAGSFEPKKKITDAFGTISSSSVTTPDKDFYMSEIEGDGWSSFSKQRSGFYESY